MTTAGATSSFAPAEQAAHKSWPRRPLLALEELPTCRPAVAIERLSRGILPAQVLMLTGLPCVTIYTIGALLMALNQQRAEAWLETAQTIGAVLFVGIAAPFGLVVSAAAMAMRPFALLPLPLSMARRRCGVSAGQILRPQWPPLLAAVCMGIVVTVMRYALQRHVSAVAMLPMLAGTGVAAYAAILGLLRA